MPNKQIKNKVEQHGPPHSPIHLLAAAKLLVQNHSCLGPQAVKQKVCIAQWWLDMPHSLNYSCGGHAAGPIVVAWWIVWDVCVCVVTCFQNTRGQLIYGLAQRRSVLKHMFFVSDFGVHHALRILIGTHILTLRPRYWPTIRRHIAPLKSPIWDRPWSSHRCICKGNQLFMSGINQPIEASLSIQVCPKKFWGWD